MELIYENSGRATFLVYTLKEGDEVDSIGLGMLGNNNIPGILPIAENHHDEERRLLFNVTSQISLSQLLMGRISRKKILTVFISICDALLEAENYLLDENYFLLDKDYVFTKAASGQANLLYLPIVRENGKINLSAFFKDLIISIQSDPDEDLNYVAKIISFLNAKDTFDLKKFREMIYKLRQPREIPKEQAPQIYKETKNERFDLSNNHKLQQSESINTPARKEKNIVEHARFEAINEQAYEISEEEKEQKEEKKSIFGSLFKKKANEENKSPFKKKTDDEGQQWGFEIPGESSQPFEVPGNDLGDNKKLSERKVDNNYRLGVNSFKGKGINDIGVSPKTENRRSVQSDMVSEGRTINGRGEDDAQKDFPEEALSQRRASLTRVSNNERKEIVGDVFRVGRQKGAVDYVITGNKFISHIHADIVKKDGKFYVIDLNSKNHTKVNGNEIISGEEYRINSGDHIFLSNEEFIFSE